MATDTGVAEKANVEDDDDLDLGAWLEETCNNDDNDSLFGAGEDDQSSLFMGDGISAPGEHISSQGLQGELLRDDPFLFLPPEVVEHQDEPLPDDPPLYLPPEVVDNQDELLEIDPLLYLPQPGESQDNTLLYSPSLPYPPTPSLPPEPHLSLPPPPSEEVRASEAPDVSIFSVNSHARIVPNPEGTQLVTQENQAIDHPQVGDAPCHDAQEGHMHTQKPVILPTFPRPRELSEAPPIDDLNNPDIRRLVGWLHLREYLLRFLQSRTVANSLQAQNHPGIASTACSTCLRNWARIWETRLKLTSRTPNMPSISTAIKNRMLCTR